MLRFASIASGSAGNALIVESGSTRILIDCGLGARRVDSGLCALGLAPADIDAILVTHEHDDHVGGVAAFARRHGTRVFLTWGTARASGLDGLGLPLVVIDSHSPFALGDLEVHPVPVPHDAREPVQYVLSDGAVRLGVLTDIGTPTPHVQAAYDGLSAIVLECNHDGAMLAGGPYPAWLKARVGGALGHLSNDQAAAFLGALDGSALQHVVAAHLSASNNRPSLAQAALAGAIGCTQDFIGVADQKTGLAWREVRVSGV
jgi:phosphoribosyl 1,2-cyclic phosphodiesterase